ELKAPDDKFPESAIRDAGYQAVWHGQSRWNGVALLSRIGEIHETRRGLPGDPGDSQSRYIEAAIGGVLIACLYLPNGNPRPGPKFDYKLDTSKNPWCLRPVRDSMPERDSGGSDGWTAGFLRSFDPI